MKLGPFEINLRPKGKDITAPDSPMGRSITVFTLLKSKWFDIDIRQCWIDQDPAVMPLHGHGVTFYRLCLLGGYTDVRRNERGELVFRRIRPGSINVIPKDVPHLQFQLTRKPVLTIGIVARWQGLNQCDLVFPDGSVLELTTFKDNVENEVTPMLKEAVTYGKVS